MFRAFHISRALANSELCLTLRFVKIMANQFDDQSCILFQKMRLGEAFCPFLKKSLRRAASSVYFH